MKRTVTTTEVTCDRCDSVIEQSDNPVTHRTGGESLVIKLTIENDYVDDKTDLCLGCVRTLLTQYLSETK